MVVIFDSIEYFYFVTPRFDFGSCFESGERIMKAIRCTEQASPISRVAPAVGAACTNLAHARSTMIDTGAAALPIEVVRSSAAAVGIPLA